MGLFGKKKNDPNSRKFRWEMARAVEGQHIKYVSEKKDGEVDEVIGRNGGLNIRDDEFIVYASAKVLFRCKVDELQIWELLSKDGVIISGPDKLHGGEMRTIIVYYVYYR